MIKVRVFEENGTYYGFSAKGHAEYADPGQDIVCAAVSAIVINTANSIEQLCDCSYSQEEDPKEGSIYFRLNETSDNTQLLMKSMLLGLKDIEKEYGDCLKVKIKED